jgi:hypothetical protein
LIWFDIEFVVVLKGNEMTAVMVAIVKMLTAIALLSTTTGMAHAEGSCPTGYGLFIEDGARIHRTSDANSPVDGLFYTTHRYWVHQFIGGTPTLPDWVNLTDQTTGVTGFIQGSVAYCVDLAPA